MTVTSQEEQEQEANFDVCHAWLLAHLANIHGVRRYDVAIAQIFFRVHHPYMCLLLVHHGCAIICPPWLLQVRQHLQEEHPASLWMHNHPKYCKSSTALSLTISF